MAVPSLQMIYFVLGSLSMINNFLPAGARDCFTFSTFVCLSVCASALITCAIYYVIRYYATAVYSSFWRVVGQATANEGSFVLPRW